MTPSASLQPLRHRNFRLQFAASWISTLGSSVAPIAVTFAILDRFDSAATLGLVLAAAAGSTLLFTLIGGVWADRLPRHRVMVASNAVQCACQGLFAVLLVTNQAQLWQILCLQAVRGAATAFVLPAMVGLTVQTVTPEHRQSANALLSMTHSLSGLAGPALAGILVAVASPAWALAADSLSFAASAALLASISLTDHSGRSTRVPFLQDLLEGWRLMLSFAWVWLTIGGFMMVQLSIMSALYVLGPTIAEGSLGGAAGWAVIVGGTGAGAVLGDLIALRWAPRRPVLAVTLAGALGAPLLLLLAIPASLVALAAAAVLLGAALTFSDTLWFSTLQAHVPENAVARVSSFDWAGSMMLRPVGYAVVGPVAAAVGTGTTLVVAASLVVLTQISLASTPAIRNLSRRGGADASGASALAHSSA